MAHQAAPFPAFIWIPDLDSSWLKLCLFCSNSKLHQGQQKRKKTYLGNHFWLVTMVSQKQKHFGQHIVQTQNQLVFSRVKKMCILNFAGLHHVHREFGTFMSRQLQEMGLFFSLTASISSLPIRLDCISRHLEQGSPNLAASRLGVFNSQISPAAMFGERGLTTLETLICRLTGHMFSVCESHQERNSNEKYTGCGFIFADVSCLC